VENALLEAALSYARRGWHVFPIHWPINGKCSCGKADCKHQGKHPLTQNGFKDATTDPKIITEWWTKSPAANIGIATGAVSGIVVVDIDNPEAKDEVKKILPSDYDINSVARSVTGRGWHLVFAHPGVEIKNRTGILAKVDVRGDGGYFIVWPSMHVSGKQYKWQVPPGDELRKLPVEFYELISRASSNGNGERERFDSSVVWEEIPDGQRDDELFRYACQLRSFNAPREVTEELIVAAAARCRPPFPTDEALKKVDQAYKYPAGHSNGTANGNGSREQVTVEPNEHDGLPVTVPDVTPVPDIEREVELSTPFPEVAWAGFFGQWRDMIGSRTEAPTEYLWGAFLLAAGVMIGRSAWRDSPPPLFPNFYLLLTGRTGDSRKSTVLWFAEQLLKNLGEDVESIHGIVSTEGLIERLAKREAVKALGYADEFRSLLSVAKRKGTQDIIPRLNSLYYCPDSESVDRREDPTTAVRPCFSLIAATPEEFVADLLGDLEITGGFLNRFLIIPGEEQPPKPIVTRPSPEEWADLVSPLRQIRDWIVSHPHRMELDERATELWGEFYTEWRNSRKAWHAKMANLSARTFEHVLKISVVYSVLASEPAISVRSLGTAILIGKWLQSNTLRLFGDAGLDQFGRAERTILGVLLKSKTGVMFRRDLQQAAFKKGINGELFGRAIKSMEANDHVRCGSFTTGSGRTRPTVQHIREQVTGKSAPDKGSTVTCSQEQSPAGGL
jgi:hypothetical protein